MSEAILSMIEQHGYLGVMLLITLENIFPPIPSEVILTFSGFMTTYVGASLFLMVLASTAGSMLGAILLYLAGYLLGKNRLLSFCDSKIGVLLHFQKEDVLKALIWFDKKGDKAVFLCRFIPIVRSLISIPAGISHMNQSVFLLLTFFGSLIWNTVLILIGHAAGDAWQLMADRISFWSKILFFLFACVPTLAVLLWHRRKSNSN